MFTDFISTQGKAVVLNNDEVLPSTGQRDSLRVSGSLQVIKCFLFIVIKIIITWVTVLTPVDTKEAKYFGFLLFSHCVLWDYDSVPLAFYLKKKKTFYEKKIWN